MAKASGWLPKVVTVACLVGTALVLNNVYADNTEVKKDAETVACGADGCAQMVGMSRSPFGQTFTFQVQANQAALEKVECSRSLVLLGAYSCKRAAQ